MTFINLVIKRALVSGDLYMTRKEEYYDMTKFFFFFFSREKEREMLYAHSREKQSPRVMSGLLILTKNPSAVSAACFSDALGILSRSKPSREMFEV